MTLFQCAFPRSDLLGRPPRSGRLKITAGQVVPRKKGGGDHIGNLQSLGGVFNIINGAMSMAEFRTRVETRILRQ